jgi:protein-glutamine gamma-glutamyltransferase
MTPRPPEGLQGAPAVTRAEPAPLYWSCAAFAGGVLLHLDRMPAWASGCALVLIAWRCLKARSAWYPGLALRAVLAVLLVGVVLVRFHTLNGLSAGTTLLILMAALKLLETRRPRDQLVVLAAALFLLVAACLDRQDLVRVPLYAAAAWLCCAALAVVSYPKFSAAAALRLSGRALAIALPLAALLFVLFPRLPGAFWAIPRGDEALTGLSDTMNPFGIGKLATNYDAAFRVKFSGLQPSAPERYWRGPVLHEFDGYSWRRGYSLFHSLQPLESYGRAYRYHVALEPTHRHWWFALDTPIESPDAHVLLTYDRQLVTTAPVDTPASYAALSYTQVRSLQALGSGERRQDTTLPAAGNPRSRQFAQQLRQRSASDAQFVNAVLDFLRRGGFVYSLEPEPLGPDPVDEFLFATRTGFCGHYASAFVVLMRAAGVPARVVTGYLGGEWNPVGEYLVVRQSDAHAWAEVWLAGRGWTRVDPTAVVAPERLQRGVSDLLPEALSGRARLMHAAPWLAELLQHWDAANAWWSERVVKFDYAAQLNVLARLGVRTPDARTLGWAFMAVLCAWLALIGWYFGRNVPLKRADPLARAYLRLCAKLARVLPRRASQGPLDYSAHLARARPDLAAAAGPLLERYAQLRYGPPSAAQQAQVAAFARAVAQLRVPARAALSAS